MTSSTRCRAILLLLVIGGGCSKFQILDALIPSGASRLHNVAYGSSPLQRMDIYRPSGAIAGKTQLPIVVFFYGGYWREGSKDNYRFVAQAFTSNSFIAVLPDTRLYPAGAFPTFVEDGASAVRWVQDHAAELGGDPTKLFLMGHSSGAHVAALLALDPSYFAKAGVLASSIRGAALLSGPYDFIPSEENRPVFALREGEETNLRIEPVHFARADAPPLLLIYGLKDRTVDPVNTPKLEAAMRAAGGDVRVIAYSKLAHADLVLAMAYPFRWLGPTLKDTLTFFRAQLD